MKSIILFLAISFFFGIASANCDIPASMKAKSAALAIEQISFEGTSLTVELQSLSVERNSWIAILSYSGVQRSYRIRFNDAFKIKRVTLD